MGVQAKGKLRFPRPHQMVGVEWRFMSHRISDEGSRAFALILHLLRVPDATLVVQS